MQYLLHLPYYMEAQSTLQHYASDRQTGTLMYNLKVTDDGDDCVETGGLEKFFQGEGRWKMKRMRKEGTGCKQKEGEANRNGWGKEEEHTGKNKE